MLRLVCPVSLLTQAAGTLATMTDFEFAVTRNENPTPQAEREEILANPAFGKKFTDHMVVADWNAEQGWHNLEVTPYAPLTLDPATTVFHYGQAIFEGIKAYRHKDDTVVTFRPDKNAQRIGNSAQRMAMPEIPEELFVQALEELVAVDKDWVPAGGGEGSLYLRPFLIATEVGLGVAPSQSYRFLVIASPVGAYFPGGVKPVSVWISEDYVRAAPGGTGAAKFAGNYAASLVAQQEASAHDCDQVVFLDAANRHKVEEMGGMNVMFIIDGKLVTPELSGTILPGVTRNSILQLAREMGIEVVEKTITLEEWRQAANSGAMTEAFACGTAAVITPIGTVKTNHDTFTIGGGESGEITMRLREKLTGIQRGEVADEHGWLHKLA